MTKQSPLSAFTPGAASRRLTSCIARVTAALVVLLLLLGRPGPVSVARADTLADYEQANATLEVLLEQRQAFMATVAAATAAEQAAQVRLAGVEQRLSGLIAGQQGVLDQQPLTAAELVDAEAALATASAERDRLARRVEVEEAWLSGDLPERITLGSRSYQAAVDDLDGVAAERLADAEARLAAVQLAQAHEVDLLGQSATEIDFWQSQAEGLAAQVGTARARGLGASGRLAALQRQGEELAAQAASLAKELQAQGYPLGVALISEGLPPIAEPLAWPPVARGYALPAGRTAVSLVAGPPLASAAARQQLASLDVEWSAPLNGPITTTFGNSTPYQVGHYAIDIAGRLYTPVLAAADGTVEFAGLAAADNRLASYGEVVLLRHGERVSTLYAHLDDRAHGLAVTAGEPVQRGQVLGYVGLSGYSTGPHLHFEVRLDNQPVDPLLVVQP